MATIVFWCFAVAAIVCALCCITQRSPVAAALWLVGTMFNLAGLYVLMHAQFVAAVQVLVYAGAVMVLFLFVIMLLNLGRTSSDFRGRPAVLGSIALAVVLVAELVVLRRTQAAGMSPDILSGIREPSTNVIGQVAEPMFRHWLIPFEVTSILLLAAIVGSVILAKRKV